MSEVALSDVSRRPAALTVTCCGTALGEPLDEVAAGQLARGFAALADPIRLRVLSLIASAGQLCSCDLLEPLGKSQPTISHHTKILAEAGLITGEKKGKWTYWRVVPGQLAALQDALTASTAAAPVPGEPVGAASAPPVTGG